MLIDFLIVFIGFAMMNPPSAAPPMIMTSNGWNMTCKCPPAPKKPPNTQAMTRNMPTKPMDHLGNLIGFQGVGINWPSV